MAAGGRSPFGPDRSAINPIIKYLLFFLNFAIWLVAGATTGLMTWVLVLKEKKVNNLFDFILDPACVMCLIGSITFVLSAFGWYGALRENVFVLTLFRWILTFFFFIEVAAIIFIFVLVYVPDTKKQLNIYPEDTLKQAIVNYRDDLDFQNLIDTIQKDLECCGVSDDDKGYLDWNANPYFNCTGRSSEACGVPFSCCHQPDGEILNVLCGNNMMSPDLSDAERKKAINTRGCYKAISDLLSNNVLVVGAAVIGILVPQMFIVCLAQNMVEGIKAQMAKWPYAPRQS